MYSFAYMGFYARKGKVINMFRDSNDTLGVPEPQGDPPPILHTDEERADYWASLQQGAVDQARQEAKNAKSPPPKSEPPPPSSPPPPPLAAGNGSEGVITPPAALDGDDEEELTLSSIPPASNPCSSNVTPPRVEERLFEPCTLDASEVTRLLGEHLVHLMDSCSQTNEASCAHFWEHLTHRELHLEVLDLTTALCDFYLEAQKADNTDDPEWPEGLEYRVLGMMYMSAYLDPPDDWFRVRLALRASYKAIDRLMG